MTKPTDLRTASSSVTRRPLLASVGALVVPAGIYGTDGQFGPGGPEPALLAGVDRAVSEALEVINHVAR